MHHGPMTDWTTHRDAYGWAHHTAPGLTITVAPTGRASLHDTRAGRSCYTEHDTLSAAKASARRHAPGRVG